LETTHSSIAELSIWIGWLLFRNDTEPVFMRITDMEPMNCSPNVLSKALRCKRHGLSITRNFKNSLFLHLEAAPASTLAMHAKLNVGP
jgi:hypothetical protein